MFIWLALETYYLKKICKNIFRCNLFWIIVAKAACTSLLVLKPIDIDEPFDNAGDCKSLKVEIAFPQKIKPHLVSMTPICSWKIDPDLKKSRTNQTPSSLHCQLKNEGSIHLLMNPLMLAMNFHSKKKRDMNNLWMEQCKRDSRTAELRGLRLQRKRNGSGRPSSLMCPPEGRWLYCRQDNYACVAIWIQLQLCCPMLLHPWSTHTSHLVGVAITPTLVHVHIC